MLLTAAVWICDRGIYSGLAAFCHELLSARLRQLITERSIQTERDGDRASTNLPGRHLDCNTGHEDTQRPGSQLHELTSVAKNCSSSNGHTRVAPKVSP